MECFSTIVGTAFRPHEAKVVFQQIALGETHFQLVREPDNQYDPLAIKVIYQDEHVGYLARANNITIANALDDGAEPEVEVVDFEGRKPVVKVSW
jgi:hypothetical protein